MVTGIQTTSKHLQIHAETVSSTCLLLIEQLRALPLIRNQFYLVGGTALALQLGHRLSVDLDFFTSEDFAPLPLAGQLQRLATAKGLRHTTGNLLGFLNDVKVEFVYYAYKPVFPLLDWEGLLLLDPRDIGLFKLLALLGRHTKKDISDLHFIDKEVIPIPELFLLLVSHYEQGDINLFKQLELLFDDQSINASEMPIMLREFDYDQAYAQIKQKLVESIRKYFGL
jgi:hypothetical protein